MMNVGFYAFLMLFLTLILLSITSLGFKTPVNSEKIGPFECGFDPAGSSRLPFCMKFFLIGVIFLVFDVEVTLIMPLPFSQTFIMLFLVVLLLGLVYEWYFGGLDWLV